MVRKLNEENIFQTNKLALDKTTASDQIFILKTLIEKYKTSNQKLYSAFIDLLKTFDSVWHKGLFYNLLKLELEVNSMI